MKLIICVIANDSPEYNKLYQGVKNTWGGVTVDGIKIIYVYGGGKNTDIRLVGDKLFVDVNETLENIGYKTISMFEYLLKHFEFEYIYRTNLSSYLVQDKLLKYLDNKPREKFYNAVSIPFYPAKFGSGAGYFLSKDVVKTIVDLQDSWDHTLLDDVALGKFIAQNTDIPLTDASRIDYTDSKDVPDYIDPKIYHFRCKTTTGDRNDDVKIFKRLHSIYYDSSNNRKVIKDHFSIYTKISDNKSIFKYLLIVFYTILIILLIKFGH